MELVVVTRKTRPALLDEAVRLEKNQNTLILAVELHTSTVSGYILYRRNGEGGYVDKIAVAEQSRRNGVGRELLQSAIENLQTSRAKSVELIVDVERKGAIALYERAGFCVQSAREDYYQPGRHAFVMQRSLQE